MTTPSIGYIHPKQQRYSTSPLSAFTWLQSMTRLDKLSPCSSTLRHHQPTSARILTLYQLASQLYHSCIDTVRSHALQTLIANLCVSLCTWFELQFSRQGNCLPIDRLIITIQHKYTPRQRTFFTFKLNVMHSAQMMIAVVTAGA